MLIDRHGRYLDYLRIAVTDKCNLRCFYCMPEEGIKFKHKSELLSYEEILRFVSLVAKEGISKIRITGGEPLIRKDMLYLFKSLRNIPGIDKLALTTNGTLLDKYLDPLLKIGIDQINLSIDSIDEARFYKITRRDYFDVVWKSYASLLRTKVDLKINCVVMANQNIDDIIPMVELTKKDKISMRFIEEMPFNGSGIPQDNIEWDYMKILDHISAHFGELEKVKDGPNSTSLNYRVPGFEGTFGVIPAFTRSFCGSCNRLRLTSEGILKTCLYDDGVFSVRDLMRKEATDLQVLEAVKSAISFKAKDGFEAQKRRKIHDIHESMTSIGG